MNFFSVLSPPELHNLERKTRPLEDKYVLSEVAFHRVISVERKRTERSRKAFLLMLLDLDAFPTAQIQELILPKLVSVLRSSIRETDSFGWYQSNTVLGVIFTDIDKKSAKLAVQTFLTRISEMLRTELSADHFQNIAISFHIFPEDWEAGAARKSSNPTLYPDLTTRNQGRRAFRLIKRSIDIVGSLTVLLIFLPLLVLIAILIKLTAKGPILYSQERVGQYGKPFTFLKFRSMYVNSDPKVHECYVRGLIAGNASTQPTNGNGHGNGHGVYKLTADKRITPLGKWLRRTSLDEFPQFWNVLRGEMSLVGPRPAIEYEVEAYELWHRRRLLEAKPGITGLWQVKGRSRVKFDEMVRLDLVYARRCSLWLDLKILLCTPWAVVMGEGAY